MQKALMYRALRREAKTQATIKQRLQESWMRTHPEPENPLVQMIQKMQEQMAGHQEIAVDKPQLN